MQCQLASPSASSASLPVPCEAYSPPRCTPRRWCAHAARVLCSLTVPVVAGAAPGGCQDVSLASWPGASEGRAAPGCKPPAVHQLCWPASGAAGSHCGITPNRSQTQAGPAPRAAGRWVLPSPPVQRGFLPSPLPRPPSSGAVSQGPSYQDQCWAPREDGLPGLPPGRFSFRVYCRIPERFTCRSLS